MVFKLGVESSPLTAHPFSFCVQCIGLLVVYHAFSCFRVRLHASVRHLRVCHERSNEVYALHFLKVVLLFCKPLFLQLDEVPTVIRSLVF
jgi:hypothetical protein